MADLRPPDPLAPARRIVRRAEVVRQLRALGVREGSALLVHTSFRAVRPVEDGVEGLLAALAEAVGPRGTLVMPTMTDGASPFDPKRTPTDGMGIVAETFWRMPGVLRSTHPGGSFAARGPLAEAICAPQPLEPPHGPDSPPGRVLDHDGLVLLLGVTHGENTTIHVAEAIADVPYSVTHPCVVEEDGVVTTRLVAETDHCCRGFTKVGDWLAERGLERRGIVGHAASRLARSVDVVAVATEHMRADPLVFLCGPAAGCVECDLARASVREGS